MQNKVGQSAIRTGGKTPELGAQDPELKNSPVAWEADEETETLRESLPDEPVCYFNDAGYAHGTVVRSGGTLLRCDHGLWIPEPTEPD